MARAAATTRGVSPRGIVAAVTSGMYRMIDFRRNKDGVPAVVASIEYDPNRSARIALLHYVDGEKRYILAPEGLQGGRPVDERRRRAADGRQLPAADARFRSAWRFTTSSCSRAAAASCAGRPASAATLAAREADWAQITLPSGEIRRIPAACRATIGTIGNSEHMNIVIGKAGRNRWMGHRPHVRGTAMNPDRPSARWWRRSHQGRSSSGQPDGQVWPRAAARASVASRRTRRSFVVASRVVMASSSCDKAAYKLPVTNSKFKNASVRPTTAALGHMNAGRIDGKIT